MNKEYIKCELKSCSIGSDNRILMTFCIRVFFQYRSPTWSIEIDKLRAIDFPGDILVDRKVINHIDWSAYMTNIT